MPAGEYAVGYTAAVPVEQVTGMVSALAAIPSSVCRCRSAWNVSTATGTGPPLASPNGPDSYMPGPPSNDNEQADSSSCLPSAAYAVGITYRSSYFRQRQ